MSVFNADCHALFANFKRLSGMGVKGLVGALALTVLPTIGHSEELQNFVKGLYGGGGIFLAVDPGARNHSAHFSSESLVALTDINRQIASGINLSSITSSLPTVTFDIVQGMPTTTEPSLGPIFGERAETIGQGHFNFSASFTHVHYTQLNGQDLSNLPILLTHEPVPGCNLSIPGCSFLTDDVLLRLNLEITRNVFAAYATYGITDRWDVGIIVPFIDQVAKVSSIASIINNSGTNVHRFDATHPSFSSGGGEATGFGDIIVRTKYNVLRGSGALPDVAVIGQINVPSGDQANLLGSGSTDVTGGVVVSKQIGRFNPHLNLGYQVASGGFDQNNLLYAVGADVQLHPSVTVGADFLGRQFAGGGGIHYNETDFSIGAKWRPIGQHVLVADFVVPVNKGTGLRPDYIAFLGYQVTF